MKIKFSYFLALAAVLVAGCSAYYSVFGLSQLFSGASTAVIIMASSLEFSKIITVTYLHRFWSRTSKALRVYLSIGVFVLVSITSAGIYGFLSNAYQKTASKLEIQDGSINILENKKNTFVTAIAANNKILESKNKRVDQLTNLRGVQETRLDNGSVKSKDKVRADINSANNDLQRLSTDVDTLNKKNASLNDSMVFYNNKEIELKNSNTSTGEVGPLKYLAVLTGYPMDKIVNCFILLLIFVFDPLAVALVIAFNKIREIENTDKNDILKTPNLEVSTSNNESVEEIESTPSEPVTLDSLFDVKSEEINKEKVKEPETLPVDEVQQIDEIDPNNEIPESGLTTEPEVLQIEEKEAMPVVKTVYEPVIPTGKIEYENIKENKERYRGYSVNVPPPKQRNSIGRLDDNSLTNRKRR